MRRFAVVSLACAFPLVFAACSDGNNSVEPTTAVAGTYTLHTVNGSPLPFTFSDGGVLISEVLTLFSDGRYSDSQQFSDGNVTVEQGVYSNNNGSITFFIQGTNLQYSGSLSGTVLTEIFTGFTLVFQKT